MFSFYVLSGLILDIFAVLGLHTGWSLLLMTGLHLVACYCIMFAIYRRRKSYKQYNNKIVGLLFLLIFFVPVLGIFSALMLTRWLRLSQKNYRKQTIQAVKESSKIQPLRERYAVGGLSHNLQESGYSLKSRVQALKAMSTLPAAKINNIIRKVLPDKQDELRLLAFNILNKQEKIFIHEISHSLELLKTENDPQRVAKIKNWLGIQYWELAYRHLVEVNLLDFILNQALTYSLEANAILKDDVSIALLLGKIYLKQKKLDAAIAAFQSAIEKGVPKVRVLTYLIEAYFYKRDFHAIKQLAQTEAELNPSILCNPIIDFWNQ